MIRKVLVTAAAILGFAAAAQATPMTWASNGHQYEAIWVGQQTSWDQAKGYAEGMGGYLATLTSAAESSFVWDLVKNDVFDGFWLGGYQFDLTMEPDGNWAWVTGETWAYTNWAAGEPNNGVNGTQHYLHFWPNNGFWDDMENRNTMKGYIVEKDPVPEPATMLLFGTGLAGLAAIRRRK